MEILLNWFVARFKNKSVYAVVLINFLPLLGVLFLKWSALSILLTYLIEAGTITFYSALNLTFLPNANYGFKRTGLFKLWFIPVFLVFILIFLTGFGGLLVFVMQHEKFSFENLYQMAINFLVIHGLFFVRNFKNSRKYYFDFFIQDPFVRLFYIGFIVMVGMWFHEWLHTYFGFLILLILIKLLLDLNWYGKPQSDYIKIFLMPSKKKR